MEFFMEKFVERPNIARFTTLLMTDTDTAKRELLQKLLTDEMVRQVSRSDARKGALIFPRFKKFQINLISQSGEANGEVGGRPFQTGACRA